MEIIANGDNSTTTAVLTDLAVLTQCSASEPTKPSDHFDCICFVAFHLFVLVSRLFSLHTVYSLPSDWMDFLSFSLLSSSPNTTYMFLCSFHRSPSVAVFSIFICRQDARRGCVITATLNIYNHDERLRNSLNFFF